AVFTTSFDLSKSDTWTFRGDNLSAPETFYGPIVLTSLPEGSYYVTLTVRDGTSGAVVGTETQNVVIRDILVVAVGDSYASGEGDPEVGNTFIDTWFFGKYQDDDPKWADYTYSAPGMKTSTQAHRSTKAAPALEALQLEKADPHTSVTFVDLAWTGAEIVDD